MDEEHVLARLDRIDELGREFKRSGAAPGQLLSQLQAELRGLLREAEELTREPKDATGGAEEVVGRLRTALARDIIGM
jgi:hypothetical protein